MARESEEGVRTEGTGGAAVGGGDVVKFDGVREGG